MVVLIVFVFPAYAGMFRANSIYTPLKPCFPRIRGDVPKRSVTVIKFIKFSPHTRGCSPPKQCDAHHTKFSPHTRGCS